MKKYWEIKHKIAEEIQDPEKRIEKIIQNLLKSRGLKKEEKEKFFKPQHPQDIDLNELKILKKEVKKAIKRIKKAIKNKEKILVYGDYDADGICASAILWETLDVLGADALPFMPLREEHGYGINQKGIKDLLKKHPRCKLIITVDNGIVAHEGIEFAKKKGIDVIITDHHQKEEKLPEAEAIVWSDEIAGAGVAWFFVREIIKELKKEEIKEKLNSELLAFSAIGTITDMMPLVGINRSFVKYGLKQLSKIDKEGLQALYEEAGIREKEISTYEVGFIIGPRMNAMGRLDDALEALRLLCTKDCKRARNLANILGKTNRERQDLTQQTYIHAQSMAGEVKQEKILLIGDASYDPGIIGLVASKLSRRFYKPSLVYSRGEELTRISARSVKGFNIIESLRGFSDLFEDLGGHPMAAGMAIKTENLGKLEQELKKLAEEKITKEMLKPILEIECEIKLSDISWNFYNELEQFSPFGYGNPNPVFMIPNLRILEIRKVGSNGNHLKIKFDDPKTPEIEDTVGWIDAIGFNQGFWDEKVNAGDNVDVAFQLDKNTWNGNTSLQMKIKEIRIPA